MQSIGAQHLYLHAMVIKYRKLQRLHRYGRQQAALHQPRQLGQAGFKGTDGIK